MIKIFVDSNVWIRPLVEKSPQANQSLALTTAIDTGLLKPYTSSIVLLEVSHVLRSFYKVSAPSITSDLLDILQTKNLTLIEKTQFNQALATHQQTKIKLTDCIIATQIPENVIFVSFDTELKRLPKIKVATPPEVLKTLK